MIFASELPAVCRPTAGQGRLLGGIPQSVGNGFIDVGELYMGPRPAAELPAEASSTVAWRQCSGCMENREGLVGVGVVDVGC